MMKHFFLAAMALAALSACAAPPVPSAPVNREVSGRPVSGARLNYPPDMQRQSLEGAVDATCTVDTQGATSDCLITKVEGSMTFAGAALAYVRGARYLPATHNGVPIAEPHHIFTIRFVLAPVDALEQQNLSHLSTDWAQCMAPVAQGQAAIDACGRAIDLSGQNPALQEAAYEQRARIYATHGQYGLAVADDDRAVASGAASIYTYRQRGLAEVALMNYPKAKSDFDFVLEAAPDDMASLRNRSRAALAMKDFTSSRRDLDHAILIRPDDPSLFVQRADLSVAAGDSAAALVDLGAALRLNPTEVPALAARCRLRQSMGQSNEAAADCARVEELDPKHKISSGSQAPAL